MTDLAEVSDELTKIVTEKEQQDHLTWIVCCQYKQLLDQCVKRPTVELLQLEAMLLK